MLFFHFILASTGKEKPLIKSVSRSSARRVRLDFLRRMPKLKTFVLSMTVEDGDLTPCLEIPYASCDKIKRHYNLKEKDLPKNLSKTTFEIF